MDGAQRKIDFHRLVRDAPKINHICFDACSKTVKIVYSSTVPLSHTTLDCTRVDSGESEDRIYCIQVQYPDFPLLLKFFGENCPLLKGTTVDFVVTASQNSEIEEEILKALDVKLRHVDAFNGLVYGTSFLLRNIEAESFTYSFDESQRYEFQTLNTESMYPFLLINIRTGVSVVLVEGENQFKRLGGSSIGGGSFLGLSELITGVTDIEEMMDRAMQGSPEEFDIFIRDIYGDRASNFNMDPHLLAASFGRVTRCETVRRAGEFDEQSKNNAILSLLRMILYNVSQLAYMLSEISNVKRVFFNGFLVRNRPIVMKTLSFACNYWSSGKLRAYFLRHENYTTGLGAFLENFPNSDMYWKEYCSGSTALGRFVPVEPLETGFKTQTFALKCTRFKAAPFSLLVEQDGKPDTIDFNNDEQARNFWIEILDKTIADMTKYAIASQKHCDQQDEVTQRAKDFELDFVNTMNTIKEHHVAYGNSNARNLLEVREQILQEKGFDDIYVQKKHEENCTAIAELPNVLAIIDKLKETSDEKTVLEYVSRGLLAGNVFDWGAKEVVKMMNSESGLSFQSAINHVEDRPWLFDGFDSFHSKHKEYKSVLIFVDNSGFDYILGIIPFARELLRNGSKVIICANTSPALNDLTHREMVNLAPALKKADADLAKFIDSEQMMFVQSGQESPCLDARRVHQELNEVVETYKTDLVVIEGMGRALHTNFNVQFKCDSLKAAVIKTQWLADRLGGKMFSVVFKHELGVNN
ncbi:CBN-PNK-4 protein [Caenorhabditis brenneri]|uniref:4'-phosphopantetheine phosphatase n=1 Tax=Caenorhabditis brenneri TaxID=135651 RepID=G0M8G5_CAEBE|nr:CBN-PNK-4 protein [Caenorhabditis brenneri]